MTPRLGLGLVLALALAQPAGAAANDRLFVFGDSFGIGTEPYLPQALPDWEVRQDVRPNRRARGAARALRNRGRRLEPVIHLSLGTVDDPERPRRFRRAARRTMRVVGPERCVVWTNIFRPYRRGHPGWRRLNRVLAQEARRRHNLVIVDWFSMVKANRHWVSPHDGTHVSERGYRHRARAVARGAEKCRQRLAA